MSTVHIIILEYNIKPKMKNNTIKRTIYNENRDLLIQFMNNR